MIRKDNDCTGDILKEIHEYGISYENRTLYLHGCSDSEDDPGVEHRMANKFVKNILLLDQNKNTINIHQHNIGGEWQSGMMIYDTIANAESYVNMICHGEISSMGTVILQAADLRLSMPNCCFMFHFGSTSIESNYLAVASYMEQERKNMQKMLDIYSKKCIGGEFFKGKKEYQVKKFLDTKFRNKGDWYLDANEAKYYGFIDGIIGQDYKLKEI